jgi:hypothetical protein
MCILKGASGRYLGKKAQNHKPVLSLRLRTHASNRMNAVWRRDTSVSTVTRLRDGRPGIDSAQGQCIFLFVIVSRPALRFTLPPRALSPRVTRSGSKADQSSTLIAAVKNPWRYISTTPYVFMEWVKRRDNFTFTFNLLHANYGSNTESLWVKTATEILRNSL